MTVLISRSRRPSAAAVLGATMVLLAAGLVALSFLIRRPGYLLQPLMIAIPSAAVGVLVARRQRRNPIGWLLLGIAAAVLLSTGAGAYSLLVYRLGRDLPLGTLGLMLYQLWSPALALFLLVILLFPDGDLPSQRWRWVAWAYGLLCGSYLALLIGVAADAISGHQIRVDDAYGGLTVVDYPTGQFAVAQDVILLLILALGLCFAWPPARQLAAFIRRPAPAAEVADVRLGHLPHLRWPEHPGPNRLHGDLGRAQQPPQRRLHRVAGQHRSGTFGTGCTRSTG